MDNNGLVEISLFEDSFSFRYVDLARCVQISKVHGFRFLAMPSLFSAKSFRLFQPDIFFKKGER